MSTNRPDGRFSGPIQQIPTGFLGFMQLKSPSGQNPVVVPDELLVNFDLSGFYLRAQCQDAVPATATIATGAGGFTAWATPMLVPQDEVWYVENYSILGTLVAGDTIAGMVPIVRYNPNGVTPFGRLGTQGSVGSSGASRILVGAEGFFLPPGSELGIFVGSSISGTSVALLGYLRKAVLPI